MTIQINGKILGQQSGIPVDVEGGFRVLIFSDTAIHMDAQAHSAFSLSFPLAEGRYQLQARYEFNNFAVGLRSEPIELSSDGKNFIELVVPDPQLLTLRAVDANGNPVEGARLNIMTSTIENFQTNDLTNAEGRIDRPIAMPPYCGARIWLEKPGYAPAWGAIHEDQSPGIVHPEDVIVMVPGAGFEGDLVDAEGQPVANTALSITLTGAGGQSWPLNATTDAAGHFTIIDQAPSEVVDIRITTFREPTNAERIRRGQPPEMNIELPGADLVDVPEADTRVWAADQVALQADVIMGLGSIARVE